MSSYAHGTASISSMAAVLVTTGSENGGVVVSNRGPVSVYLGGSSVTADQASTGGLELVPGEKVTLSTVANVSADLYAVTASGTTAVSWIAVTSA